MKPGAVHLRDFELDRDGATVVSKWQGSPRLTIGVWGQATDAEAFEQAAAALERGDRQGMDPGELSACALEMRMRAASLRMSEPEDTDRG